MDIMHIKAQFALWPHTFEVEAAWPAARLCRRGPIVHALGWTARMGEDFVATPFDSFLPSGT